MRWLSSLLLFGLLIWWVNPASVEQALRQTHPWPLVWAIALLLVHRILMALRWRMILTPLATGASTVALVRITLVSSFFVNFLPSSLSADVVRGYFLRHDRVSTATAAASVILDRLVGLAVLLLFAAVAGPIACLHGLLPAQWFWAFCLAAGLIITAVALVASPWFYGLAARLTASRWRLTQTVGRTVSLARQYPWTAGRAISVVAFSAGMLLLRVYTFYLTSRAVGGQVQYAYFLIAVPAVELIRLVPVTVSGLGVQEGAWTILLSQAGMLPGQALLFALLKRAEGIVVSLPGGLLYAWYSPPAARNVPPVADQQLEKVSG